MNPIEWRPIPIAIKEPPIARSNHRRSRFSRLAPMRAAARKRLGSSLPRQSRYRQQFQRSPPPPASQISFRPPGCLALHRSPRPRRRRPAFRVARQPARLSEISHPNPKSRCLGHPQFPRPRHGEKCPLPPRLHFRMLRRSASQPPTRKLLGPRKSRRPPRRVRRIKRYAEAMTMAYHRYHGLDTRIVRIFNTYGPRMRLNDGRALPNFLYQALVGDPITVYGDGKQTRSFCFVSDLLAGIYKLLESNEHEPTNIGNPQEITILEFAERVRKLVGATTPIVFRPLPQDDPKQRCPDITKAKRLLNWEPKVTLEEGLQRTYEYFREKLAQSTPAK